MKINTPLLILLLVLSILSLGTSAWLSHNLEVVRKQMLFSLTFMYIHKNKFTEDERKYYIETLRNME